MGNVLEYPGNAHSGSTGHNSQRSANGLQGTRPVILPFNSFNIRPDGIEETEVKSVMPSPDSSRLESTRLDLSRLDSSRLEVETTKFNTSATTSHTSNSQRGRYIKRYRNEEEKLMDMLKERELMLKSAIRQGQQLRAKCNRYAEEIDSLKAINSVDMTNSQWKKKHNDLDKKYRNLKEELEVMTARNKNGRDYLKQQNETIDLLNLELQQERLERQHIVSNSLPNLSKVGLKDKKGKRLITQLQIDKNLLEDRVLELTQRNQRGREYLARLESDKKDQDDIIANLEAQLQQEKAEKESLLTKANALTNTNLTDEQSEEANVHHTRVNTENDSALYAQVLKIKRGKPEDNKNMDDTGPPSPITEHENHFHAEANSDNTDVKSTGFETVVSVGVYERFSEVEVDNDVANADKTAEAYCVQSGLYEDVEVSNGHIMQSVTNDTEMRDGGLAENMTRDQFTSHSPVSTDDETESGNEHSEPTATNLDFHSDTNTTHYELENDEECVTRF